MQKTEKIKCTFKNDDNFLFSFDKGYINYNDGFLPSFLYLF